tara:strand:+ start:501 stop:743 length:243 start_codon:yes stop_codon:yes gene_type:complete
MKNVNSADLMNRLIDSLEDYCDSQNLEARCADEMLCYDILTTAQREWLMEFLISWDEMLEIELNERKFVEFNFINKKELT